MMPGLVLPLWAEVIVSALLICGSMLTLIGCLGLWRFRNFYQRMHGPTLGATMGMVCVLLASMLYFTMTDDGPAVHEVLIAVFLTMTVPATTLMLARAALYRHRRAGRNVPPEYDPAQSGGAGPAPYRTGDMKDEHYFDSDEPAPGDGASGKE